jgi:hypothetical protein
VLTQTQIEEMGIAQNSKIYLGIDPRAKIFKKWARNRETEEKRER